MNEEIVLILDANLSMGEELIDDHRMASEDFLGTTKFDVARYIVQELLYRSSPSSLSIEDQTTRILALIALGKRQSDGMRLFPNHNYDESVSARKKRKRSWLPLEGSNDKRVNTESTDSDGDGGCCCYICNEIDQTSSIDRFKTILKNIHISHSSSNISEDGDFVTGIVRATDVIPSFKTT